VVREIAIYLEGGGDTAETIDPFRRGMSASLKSVVKLVRADDTQCQMMVASMDAWLLPDPAGLKKHYVGKFNEKALPPASQAETRTKDTINDALKRATRRTPAAEYQKIRDGAKLLEKVDPTEVREHCKWCDRLFETLDKAIGAKA